MTTKHATKTLRLTSTDGPIGMTVEESATGLHVSAVVPKAAAARAGVAVGDRITRLDGVATTGLSEHCFIDRIRAAREGAGELEIEFASSDPPPAPEAVGGLASSLAGIGRLLGSRLSGGADGAPTSATGERCLSDDELMAEMERMKAEACEKYMEATREHLQGSPRSPRSSRVLLRA